MRVPEDPAEPDQAADEPYAEGEGTQTEGQQVRVAAAPPNWRAIFRAVAAVGTAFALAAILASTTGASNEELDRLEPSAVRLAAIFAEGAFYAVTTVGALLAAYVLSRAE